MDSSEAVLGRLTKLETSWMHLQSDYESLNEVVLENSRRLKTLTDLVNRLNDQMEKQLATTEPRDIGDEKPPHY